MIADSASALPALRLMQGMCRCVAGPECRSCSSSGSQHRGTDTAGGHQILSSGLWVITCTGSTMGLTYLRPFLAQKLLCLDIITGSAIAPH